MTTETRVDEAVLAAFLAEELFGWTLSGDRTYSDDAPDGDILYLVRTGNGLLDVLEAMRERGWLVRTDPWENGEWRAQVYRVIDAFAGYAVQHGTLPVAIESIAFLPLAVAQAARAAIEAEYNGPEEAT